MFSGRTTTTVTAPTAAPVDYNATRPTFRELAPLFGLALITLPRSARRRDHPLVTAEGRRRAGRLRHGLTVRGWPYGAGRPALFLHYSAWLFRAPWPATYARIGRVARRPTRQVYGERWPDPGLQVSEWEHNPPDVRKVAFCADGCLSRRRTRTLSIDRLMKQALWVRAVNKSIPYMLLYLVTAPPRFSTCLRPRGLLLGGPRPAGEITFGRICARLRCGRWAKALEDPRALASVEVQEAQ